MPAQDLSVSKDVSFISKEGDDFTLEELREELASLDKYAESTKAFEAACKLKSYA
ncbi:hypothetical protein AB6G29_23825 [Providencia hangzhouensis]|uniref:hypothetical protein n=1 Tax=Providencia hangzhouensis TaxID=3031799 RepID=UPI0034DDCA3C